MATEFSTTTLISLSDRENRPPMPPPRRGVFRVWFRRVFGISRRAPLRVEDSQTVRTPAKGGGFDFTVTVTAIWTAADDLSLFQLQQRVEDHKADVWDLIQTEVRQVGHCYPPDHAKEAEEALLHRLACEAQKWRLKARSDGVQWEPRIAVAPDEEVKRLQQGFWVDRLRQSDVVGYSTEQVAALHELVEQWRALLTELNVDNWRAKPAAYLAPFLVELALKPIRANETLFKLTNHRLQYNRHLLQVVEDAINSHQDLNTYEFVTTYESALTQLLKHVSSEPVAELWGSVDDGHDRGEAVYASGSGQEPTSEDRHDTEQTTDEQGGQDGPGV